jgi:hypothetical protein
MTDPGAMQPTTPPPPSPPTGAGGPQGNPWERRDTLGFGGAFLEAIKLFVTSPAEAFAQTKRSGDYASPLIFAVLVGWIGVVISQIWSMLFNASMFSMFPGEMGDQMGAMAATGIGAFIGTLVLAPIFVAIGLFIWAGVLHLCLMLVGGLSASTSGFEGTFRVVSYITVAQLSNIIPLAGWLIAVVWSIVLGVIGITDLHRTTQGKATAAILIPIALCCVCAMILGATLAASMMAMLGGQGG